MGKQVVKNKENKSRAVENSVVRKKKNENRRFSFVDDRLESVMQREFKSSSYAAIRKIKPENIKSGFIEKKISNVDMSAPVQLIKGTVCKAPKNLHHQPFVIRDDQGGYYGVPYGVQVKEGDLVNFDVNSEFCYLAKNVELLILKTLEEAARLPDKINAVMEHDNTREYRDGKVSPQEQLKKCLEVCKDKTSEEIALYLYTTYFYKPINNYLRTKELSNKVVQELIDITSEILINAFENSQEKILSHFRMELRPSLWIGDKKVGDTLSFPAFTSMHPDIKGVNNMWGNIESGAFGTYEDRLALLVFEGGSKLLRPELKYFRKEVEDILPPETMAKIMKKEKIEWTNPKTNKVWVVDVYQLMVLPATTDISVLKFGFTRYGDVFYKLD